MVEDDPGLRQVLELMLGKLGCAVISEGDGERAMQRLTTLSPAPDLILTDLSLPGLDGYGLLRAVRQKYPGSPVVFVTGHQGENLTGRGDIRPDAILQKPVGMTELRQVLERFGA